MLITLYRCFYHISPICHFTSCARVNRREPFFSVYVCVCLPCELRYCPLIIEFFFFSSCLFHFHFLGTTQVLHSSFILFILLFIFHLAQIHVCLQQSGFKKILQVSLAGTFGPSNRSYYQPPGSSSGYPFIQEFSQLSSLLLTIVSRLISSYSYAPTLLILLQCFDELKNNANLACWPFT